MTARTTKSWAISAAVLTLGVVPALALEPKERREPLDAFALAKPETWVTAQHEPVQGAALALARPATRAAHDALVARTGVPWSFVLDRVTGEMAVMEGGGVPWIPGTGRGNHLVAQDLALDPRVATQGVPPAIVEARARAFVADYPELFAAPASDLVLMRGASGPMLDYLYYVDFAWHHRGIPVENAHVVFRLNHGNLVQVGQEYVSKSIAGLDTAPALSAADAWGRLWGYLGGQGPFATDRGTPAELRIIPVSTPRVVSRQLVEPGTGLGYRLVWVMRLMRDGQVGTWEARVDAHRGEIVSFRDVNRYGRAHGGVYPSDRPAAEVDRPTPFVDCGGGVFTDGAGFFSGNNCTSAMNGTYTRVVDSCGSISLTTTSGDLNFGTSGGLDCTTPGSGGAGNTHAARTQFYNVTLIKRKALTYFANAWLNGQLRDNTNLTTGTCNAFWNGSTINFYQSGAGCNNTGELPGISLHEFGHGLDTNDGSGSSPNEGTGETYGDVTAVLQTHTSCLGQGFSGANSGGYGDACTDCTGVRDIDYGKRTAASPHFAEDITSNTCTGCTPWNCPADAFYNGPCGYEGHCESYISSEPVWDLANRDLPALGFDTNTAWQMVDRYWYASRPTATSAYACPSLTTTDGCAAGSLSRVFRVVDDDDGNLANGTPHASAIAAAFTRHKINCAADVITNSSACPALGTTSVFATPGNGQVVLDWSDASGATRYLVYRNEMGCDQGYTRLATVNDPTITYTDTLVVNGVTYSYRILPAGSTDACHGSMSNCASGAPLSCTPPPAPAGASAAPNGNYRIDVTWTDVAGELQYDVFRGTVSGGPYAYLGSTGAGVVTYADTTVNGGITYYYVIRAYNGCYSRPSGQGSATAAGTCNLPPTFAGATAVTNDLLTPCRQTVSWAAGTSSCAGTLSYSVYRSDLASFTPGPAFLIASGVSGTSFQDTGVAYQRTYHYIVRAVDSISGLEDGNLAVRSGYPTGAQTVVDSNNFESNMTGWSTAGGTATTGAFVRGDPVGTVDNYGGPCQPEFDHTTGLGTQCLYTATNPAGNAGVDDVDGGEARLTSPAFNVSAYPSAMLDMWRWYVNEDSDPENGDYYYLEISNNGGSSWTALESFPDTYSTSGGAGLNAWRNVQLVLEGFVPLTNNMLIRFRVADEPTTGDLIEFALDDYRILGINSCTSCTAPPVPTGVSAVATAANTITVSWNNMGAASYAVFRSEGACPGTMVQIAGNLTGTAFADTTVSAGTLYAYTVRSHGATHCESAASACASATATGTCTKPPLFAGVATVANSHTATCGVTLAWAAATPGCGGAVTYDIHRATAGGFTPSPTTRIASGVTGTGYTDTAGLTYGTTYYYLVRAVEGVREDANTVIKSDGPSGGILTASTIYFTNFDSGTGIPSDWSASTFVQADDPPADVRGAVACLTPAPPSGTNVFRWGGIGCTDNYGNNHGSFAIPEPDLFGLKIPFDATNARLQFSHRWDFQSGDGATILMKRAVDGPYYILPGTIIVAGAGYNGVTGAATPVPNAACWTGAQASYVSTTIDLDAACVIIGGTPCRGETLEIAFTGVSNANLVGDGWFFDDVRITADYGASCSTAGCGMLVSVTPAAATVAPGQTITFQAQHTLGIAPFGYQWTENGVNVPGATLPYLAVSKASAGTFTYNCRVTDSSGLCTNVVDATPSTGTWQSGPTPPPVGDGAAGGGTAATFVKSGANDILATWDIVNCSGTNSVILWNAIGTFGGYAGSAVCAAGIDGNETFTPPAGSVWFNILWTDGGTAGHPGFASTGARTWTASGQCTLSADSSGDPLCN